MLKPLTLCLQSKPLTIRVVDFIFLQFDRLRVVLHCELELPFLIFLVALILEAIKKFQNIYF